MTSPQRTAADELRAQLESLLARYGHLAVGIACIRTLVGYAREGARTAAANAGEVFADEPLPDAARREVEEITGSPLMTVGPELRSELAGLRKQLGHQGFYIVVSLLAEQFVHRGGRACEVDALAGPDGTQTCAPPPCPGCRERLAAAKRWRETLQRTKDHRPQGGADAAAIAASSNDGEQHGRQGDS